MAKKQPDQVDHVPGPYELDFTHAEDMTEQSHARGTNPNDIVRRYYRGEPITVPERRPRYGDFSEAGDFQTQMYRVTEAQDQFQNLPAAVRDRCRNDPAKFLELTATPEGVASLVKLGMDPTQAPPDSPDCPSPLQSQNTSEAARGAAKSEQSPGGDGSPEGGS